MGISNVSAQQNIGSNERSFDTVRRSHAQRIPVNTVDKTPGCDTVEIGNENKGNKYKKAALAIIGTALAAIGIYALSKGRSKNALKDCGEKAQEVLKEGKNKADETLQKGESKVKTEAEKAAEEKVRKAEEELKAAKQKEEEARIKAEKEAKERAEAKAKEEARIKAEKEAQAKAEAEAKKAEEEARLKAEQEAKVKAEKEAQAEAKRQAERQRKYEWAIDTSEKYVTKHMKELDELLLNKEGQIGENYFNSSAPRHSFNDLFKPYTGEISEFYHATTAEAKEKILQEGFNQRLAPTHGYLNGVGGSYFALNKNALADGGYGSNIITARFNGKIAEFNPNLLDDIKHGNTYPVFKKLVKDGMNEKEANDLAEHIVLRYLQEKLFSMGYQGVVTTEASHMAGCNYFSALDPKLIQIIK